MANTEFDPTDIDLTITKIEKGATPDATLDANGNALETASTSTTRHPKRSQPNAS